MWFSNYKTRSRYLTEQNLFYISEFECLDLTEKMFGTIIMYLREKKTKKSREITSFHVRFLPSITKIAIV